MAHLNRYKRYPSGAAGTGTASVAFTIARSGQVLSARLIGSSGNPALDAEAVSLPRHASPVPAPPPDFGGGRSNPHCPNPFRRMRLFALVAESLGTGRKVNSMRCKVRMRVPALLLFCAALTATMSEGHAQEITIYNARHRSLTAEWVEGFTRDTGLR
jgi:TonB family protein